MTLIISAVIGDYAVQVSDRRLTYSDGRIFDDEANKAVVFCGRVVFAYTGLGYLGRQRTDAWLTQALVNARTESLSVALDAVARQANDRLRSIHLAKVHKRLAFVGVGWSIQRHAPFLRPIICSVSNAHADDGSWLPEAEAEFMVRYSIGPEQPSYNVVSSGYLLPAKQASLVRRSIRRCFDRGTGPEPAARLLVRAVQAVSVVERTVGSRLMVSCVPKHAVLHPEQQMLTNLDPSSDLTTRGTASFAYVYASRNEAIQYGPNGACNGEGFRDLTFKRLNDTGSDAEITMTFVSPEH
jgi:hypothetical protein